MGWWTRLLRGGTRHGDGTSPATSSEAPLRIPAAARFAVVDVETTGLSPRSDRVIELAVVLLDHRCDVVSEWVHRFDPEGPVGATHIHGITAHDLVEAPLFRALSDDIDRLLRGRVVVGHNLRFDLAFLRAELLRCGQGLDPLATVCTLELAQERMPGLPRHRLMDVCAALGIDAAGAHSALGDARATAAVLRTLRGDESVGAARRQAALPQPGRYADPRVREMIWRRIAQAEQRPVVPLLEAIRAFDLGEALDEGAPEGAQGYLELLIDALDDGELSPAELGDLADLRDLWGLTDEVVAAAEDALPRALARRALDDGRVTRAEKGELLGVAALLGRPSTVVSAVLESAEAERNARLSAGLRPIPSDWAYGEPLRVGDKVVVTGCEWTERTAFEERAERLGVRIIGSVSRRTALLVTDGSFAGSKLEAAVALGTRTVTPGVFAILLDHLQPAESQRTSRAEPQAPPQLRERSASVMDPAVVRAWARSNGVEVGTRGRLPASLVARYEAELAG